ncbi:MAG: DUF177 domain-containing protein [Alphaproteobacteria bacterium]|nr:DUF177 domain-containing protein [Alphaproteobacteria bacterium]MCW5739573.1 DUF177 domain-containing protein [Alphaproteobacteria bacterium]
MTAPPEELSRLVRLERVPARGMDIDVQANDAERAALARRFELLDLPALQAQVSVRPGVGGVWTVSGRLRAEVVQACVVTLEPVPQAIDETFDLRFAAGAGGGVDDPDAPEPLEGDTIDVGAIVADHLSLALDPFPRAPGATYEPAPEPGDARPNPFAALEGLKSRLKGRE